MRWGNLFFPFKDLTHQNIAAGLIAGIFVITGPTALILEASSNGNFDVTQTVLWVFAVYVFGGLFGIFLPLYYRIPITGGHTLTGVAFLATTTSQFSYHELLGAFIVSGILMLLIGVVGFFSKLIKIIPKEVISAMLAGMITKYMVDFIVSVNQLVTVGVISMATFFIFSKWKTKIPPVIAAIVIGFIVLFLSYPLDSADSALTMVLPQPHLPEFNLLSFISVSLPLALLILSNDTAVALGALEQNKYKVPVDKIVSSSGVFSIFASFFGGQSANIAGMATVICSDDEAGPKEKRYMGSVVAGILLLVFGIFAWKLVPFIQALPKEFIAIMVGFSLFGVFGNNLNQSFSRQSLKMSTTFAFIIALSGITIASISAPVWALLVGTLIARNIEK
ncbi:benzoate/H(+) symporter BenE family transporter [Anaerobacillus sp. CMMVII]|nr:benzoate/H(+) symporter BenE family transporter [Anaerobacillus sp. CMMVII]